MLDFLEINKSDSYAFHQTVVFLWVIFNDLKNTKFRNILLYKRDREKFKLFHPIVLLSCCLINLPISPCIFTILFKSKSIKCWYIFSPKQNFFPLNGFWHILWPLVVEWVTSRNHLSQITPQIWKRKCGAVVSNWPHVYLGMCDLKPITRMTLTLVCFLTGETGCLG